jgi:hypothetical protein
MKNNMIVNLVMSVLLIASLVSCSKPSMEQHEYSHEHGHSHNDAHESKDLTSYGFIKLKDHYFKLAPDISQTKESHLDFYFKDADAKHVSGAEIKLILIAPDSSKEEFTLVEDEAGEHYHTKTMLRSGKYEVVAQVKQDGEIYNPRFEFEV